MIDFATALVAFLRDDAQLIGLIGTWHESTRLRLQEGWIGEEVDESSYPLCTLTVVRDAPVGAAPGAFREGLVQLDVWAADITDLPAVDDRFLALLDQVQWDRSGVRYGSYALGGEFISAERGYPRRLRRDFYISGQIIQ